MRSYHGKMGFDRTLATSLRMFDSQYYYRKLVSRGELKVPRLRYLLINKN